MGEKQKHVEANALAPIPKEERQSWISLALVQAGICVCASSFLEGALLAEAMPLGEAILSGALGNLLVVIFMTIIGFAGSDLGLASCTLSESCFGKTGARYLVSVVFAINLVGWFGITNEICGDAFTNFMAETFNIHFPLLASNILWGLIMLITAVYGMRAMEKLNAVSIPFLGNEDARPRGGVGRHVRQGIWNAFRSREPQVQTLRLRQPRPRWSPDW